MRWGSCESRRRGNWRSRRGARERYPITTYGDDRVNALVRLLEDVGDGNLEVRQYVATVERIARVQRNWR